ncbi:MAG TPA: hypothetical protein VGO86_05555 [Candidatus Dormibacteraeota bacterium]
MELGELASPRTGTHNAAFCIRAREWCSARVRRALVAGAAIAALVAVGPSGAWADQANDNGGATTAGTGLPASSIVAPLTSAVGVNLVCPGTVNVLSSQRDAANCEAHSQSNANASGTTVGDEDNGAGRAGGAIVAPVTAAAGANVSCPLNLNVASAQRGSGNCSAGDQSSANRGVTQVAGGGSRGGPIVAPVTGAVGANLACPADVNVLSSQRDSGNCRLGDQSNANRTTTRVGGGGAGAIVAPVTGAIGLNLACPIVFNVLSSQQRGGDCTAGDQSNTNDGATHVGGGRCADPSEGSSRDRQGASCDSVPPGPGGTRGTQDAGAAAPAAGVTHDAYVGGGSLSSPGAPFGAPAPPATGAMAIGMGAPGYPSLGLLVLAALAAVVTAVRRLAGHR